MVKNVTEVIIHRTKLCVIQGDITKQDTEAIVNAANSSLMGGSGVDGAIHRTGGPAVIDEYKQIVSRQGSLPTGMAVITTSGNLIARYVIHTVGPIWCGGGKGEPELLANAYRESLKLAEEKHLASISFPSISTGAYSYPLKEAAQVAINTVVSFLYHCDTSLREVLFVLFDRHTFKAYSSAIGDIIK